MSGTSTKITSVDGDIAITATAAADAATSSHDGIRIAAGKIQSTGTTANAAKITIDGAAGAGEDSNDGAELNGANVLVTSVAGAISITGTGAGSDDHNRGVAISNSAKVQATGNASITIDGAGASADVANYGVLISSATVESTSTTATATLSISGTGGAGSGSNRGVDIRDANALVSSAHAPITIVGEGGAGGRFNYGVLLLNGAELKSTSAATTAGTITVTGTGGDGSGDNRGVQLESSGALLSSSHAAVDIDGTGGAGDQNNHGVFVVNGADIKSDSSSATAGDITIDGTGGAGAGNNRGVHITSTGTTVVSGLADIKVTGTGGGVGSGGGDGNAGVIIDGSALIESTGAGADAAKIVINGTGAAANNSNRGVHFGSAATRVRSADGAISISGTGGAAAANGSNDGIVFFAGTVESTGIANIAITANGGAGSSGLWMQSADSAITSKAGNITISGTGGTTSGRGLTVINSTNIETTTTGDISITGTGSGGSEDFLLQDSTLGDAASTGDITITTDSQTFSGTTSIQSKGDATLKPRTAAASIGVGGGAGTVSISDNDISALANGFNSITIGDTASGTGAVTVNTATFLDPVVLAGGALKDNTGVDLIAPSVTFDGALQPGLSPGILDVNGNSVFDNSSSFDVELGGATAGNAANNHDQLDVAGTVNLGAGVPLNISLVNGYSPLVGDQLVIINNDSTDAVTGEFAGKADDSSFTVANVTYTIDYDGGDNNDVVLTVSSGFDFGDAPSTYAVTIANSGAQHTATGIGLGSARDLESDGQESANADADDTTGSTDDEDGVNIRGSLNRGDTAAFVDVQVTANGFLNAWIDYNQDSTWDNATESIYSGAVSAGFNRITFSVPFNATIGTTYARFRVNDTAANLSPTGAALSGEVEDYEVEIGASGVWASQGGAPVENGQIQGPVIPNKQVNGATHVVIAHPTDGDTLYVGGVNGGIWKTTNATAINPNWTSQTDFLDSLSIGAMDFDPTDGSHNTLVAGFARYSSFGGVAGARNGILRTTDGGANWFNPGSIGLIGNRVSGIAARGDTIVASSHADPGGIYRSTDGGATFAAITNGDFGVGTPFTDMVVDKSDATGQRLYAASIAPNAGLFRSDDFGATWSKISGGAINQDILAASNNIEMAVHPTTGRLYAAILVGARPHAIYHTNTGANATPTWTRMDIPILPLAAGVNLSDASFATPIVITSNNHGLSNTDFVAIRDVLVNTNANGLFSISNVTTNTFELDFSAGNGGPSSGGVWTKVTGPNPTFKDVDAGGQGRTHFSIVVDPLDEKFLYIGGDRQDQFDPIGDNTFSGATFRGDASITRDPTVAPSPQWDHLSHTNSYADDLDGGTANGTATHADSREMVFTADGVLVEVDDGGIFKRTNHRDNTGDWFSLVGDISMVEYHDIAYNTATNQILGGTQDNGTHVQLAQGSETWTRVQGGDGGDVLVDTTSLGGGQSIIYSSSQRLGGFTRRTYDAAGNQTGSTGVALTGAPAGVDWPFDTSLAINNIDPTRLLLGHSTGAGLFESTDQGDNISSVGSGIVASASTGHSIDYGGTKSSVDNEDVAYVARPAVRFTSARRWRAAFQRPRPAAVRFATCGWIRTIGKRPWRSTPGRESSTRVTRVAPGATSPETSPISPPARSTRWSSSTPAPAMQSSSEPPKVSTHRLPARSAPGSNSVPLSPTR
ncbi:MAG: GEVED domain-containing protein, partial [Pirellulaceae bacterium]|jgi:hypothetical protein|nr:GEVED domain-containing protein [Pirellulaceae bacterium]